MALWLINVHANGRKQKTVKTEFLLLYLILYLLAILNNREEARHKLLYLVNSIVTALKSLILKVIIPNSNKYFS